MTLVLYFFPPAALIICIIVHMMLKMPQPERKAYCKQNIGGCLIFYVVAGVIIICCLFMFGYHIVTWIDKKY
jgi:energy-converting hydrogenase Eha subunit A